MATLTTRKRDRRATQYVTGVAAALAIIATLVVHRQLLSSNPLAFWLPTVAGLAYGSLLWGLGSRRNSKWLSNLTMAGWLVIFWVLLGTKVVSGPAWFIAVMIGAIAVTAAFPKKPKPSTVRKRPLADIQPWSGSGVAAAPATYSAWKRTLPGITIATGDRSAVFPVESLAAFFDGELGTAESTAGPSTFLTRVGVAAPDSIVGEVTAGLADGTLVLLDVAGDNTSVVATFTPADAEAFEQWVRTIPED